MSLTPRHIKRDHIGFPDEFLDPRGQVVGIAEKQHALKLQHRPLAAGLVENGDIAGGTDPLGLDVGAV